MHAKDCDTNEENAVGTANEQLSYKDRRPLEHPLVVGCGDEDAYLVQLVRSGPSTPLVVT
jgi:hypothetical protein